MNHTLFLQVLTSQTISIMGLQKTHGQLIALDKNGCESMKVVLVCQVNQNKKLCI